MKVNRNKTRLRVRKQLEVIGLKLPVQPLSELIQWLTKRLDQYGEDYKDISLVFEQGEDLDGPYQIALYGTRPENLDEYAERMKLVEAEEQAEKEKAMKYSKFIESEAKKLGIV